MVIGKMWNFVSVPVTAELIGGILCSIFQVYATPKRKIEHLL